MRFLLKRLLWSAGVLAALLLSPSVALAANVYVQGESGRYVADPGEANDITVTKDSPHVFRIVDQGATIAAGDGCESVSAHEVTCSVAMDFIRFSLGDQDDSASAAGADGFFGLSGEGGDDTLEGGLKPDDLWGGPGSDTVRAGPAIDPGEEQVNYVYGGSGDDTLIGGLGNDIFDYRSCDPGADEFIGGGGYNRVSYKGCDARVGVTLDDVADDGAVDEGDNVHSDIDSVNGTRFGDHLIGNGNVNSLSGNGGNDVISAFGGRDVLAGGLGKDTLRGGGDHDHFYGQGGDDTIYARDRLRDVIEGGSGFDRARINRGLDSVKSIEAFF
jgi:Ca2+-binding RTX toxin-like protein